MKYFYCDSYFYLVIEIYQLLELMLVKNSSEQKIVLKSWKNCIKILEKSWNFLLPKPELTLRHL